MTIIQKGELMDDLISRQAAIDALTTYIYNVYKAMAGKKMPTDKCRQAAESVIGELPPVQPKHGKWLPDNRCGGGYWVCSSCKYPTEAFAADVIYKYCPFCGADMREVRKDAVD